MKIIHQISVYFVIILLIAVAGMGVMFNRVHKMNIAHMRLIQEWKELRLIMNFMDDIDEIISIVSANDYSDFEREVFNSRFAKFTNDLDKIRESSLSSESFEDDEHVLTERDDFSYIYENYQKLGKIVLDADFTKEESYRQFQQLFLYELNQIREAGLKLQNFYVEQMRVASGDARKTQHQILYREIFIFIMLIILVGGMVFWFIQLIKKNTDAMLQHEKSSTIGLLAQGLAHEIRNPLGIISTAASVVRDKLPPNSEERQLGNDMIEETKRISSLLDQLLHLNQENKVFISTNPAEIIEQVMSLLLPTSQKMGVTMQFHHHAGMAKIDCDQNQVKQVLINILLNSIHASSPQGNIEIISLVKNKMYSISIADNGNGFTPEALKRAFEPFFTTKNNGTGLGLFVARNIMDAHQGRLLIESTPKTGTKVILLFPLKGEDKNA